jgi:hypothetical protein
MKAQPFLREKRILVNQNSGELAIAELKIWKIPKSKDYPRGIKFSLFLEGALIDHFWDLTRKAGFVP